MADVFKEHSLTGGTSVVDIIAHVGLDGKYVYAGGLGDAFCKLTAESGKKVWCVDISVPVDFIIIDNFAFVVGADNNLYAVNTIKGDVYWRIEVKKQKTPKYDGKNLIVGKQKINYTTGKIID
jgi:outer membrane protein assembly factor BamB